MWREEGKNSVLRQKYESKHVKKRTSQNMKKCTSHNTMLVDIVCTVSFGFRKMLRYHDICLPSQNPECGHTYREVY